MREECRLSVFYDRALKRIFGLKRDAVTSEWSKLHIKELNDLYFSSSVVWVIKSRRLRWAEHVAYGREGWRIQGLVGGNLRERDHF
jgi:hypothetical protein